MRARGADQGQADADDGADEQRPGEDQPSREPVGQVTGGEGEQEHGQELGQSDPAEIQGRAVLGVDLPADRHLEHLEADHHPQHGQPPEAEVTLLQRGPEALHGLGAGGRVTADQPSAPLPQFRTAS